MSLLDKKCVPCEGGVSKLSPAEIKKHLPNVKGWSLKDGKLTQTWTFEDFVEASAWLEKIKFLAEAEGHHPDIHWYWNTITLDIITHAISGLSENDFILAAKISALK